MMKFKLFSIALLLTLGACTTKVANKKKEATATKVQDQRTSFDDKEFKDDTYLKLLKELDICVLSDSLTGIAQCSPRNFKIIPFKKDTPLEDAFILEIKAGITLKNSPVPLPLVRHIVVFERVNGQLVKLNGFRGDIIATQGGKKADDLILALYLTEDETLFHCLFTFDGDRYIFKSIEGLDYGEGVKILSPATKDSTTEEIYAAIIRAKLMY